MSAQPVSSRIIFGFRLYRKKLLEHIGLGLPVKAESAPGGRTMPEGNTDASVSPKLIEPENTLVSILR